MNTIENQMEMKVDIEMKKNVTNVKAFQAFVVDKKGIARNENAFVYGLLYSANHLFLSSRKRLAFSGNYGKAGLLKAL